MTVFVVQQQSRVVAVETMLPTRPKVLLRGPWQKKFWTPEINANLFCFIPLKQPTAPWMNPVISSSGLCSGSPFT